MDYLKTGQITKNKMKTTKNQMKVRNKREEYWKIWTEPTRNFTKKMDMKGVHEPARLEI